VSARSSHHAHPPPLSLFLVSSFFSRVCVSSDDLLQLEVHGVLGVDHHAAVDLAVRQLHRHLVTLHDTDDTEAQSAREHRDTVSGLQPHSVLGCAATACNSIRESPLSARRVPALAC
jgi:hypothetical protein